MIARDKYLNRLIAHKNNGLIKVVTGLRRSGKSFLLNTIFHNHLLETGTKPEHIIEIAFDDRHNKKLRNPDELLAFVDSKIVDAEVYYLILDEIQLVDEFEDVLNSLLHIKNADVYVTGSNSKFLSSDIITEFRGRGDEIHVFPLSFAEYVSAYKGSVGEAWDDYFNYGGLPLILSYDEAEEKEQYLSSLMTKTYLSDILERHKVKNAAELDELLDILSSAIGSLTNPLKLQKTFQSVKHKTITDKTISKYISYFEDSFLISRTKRYDIKGKKYINALFKYYFEDVGLRNARLGFRQTEENHIMENIIYNELRYRGYQVDVGVVEHFGKDKNQKTVRKTFEVDFVATKGSERLYIQSAFAIPDERKAQQEKNSLLNISDSFKKIIIVKDDKKPRADENGIVTIGIKQFLLDAESLEK